MRRFYILIQASILSISISPTSSWKNIFGKCWKILGGITILTSYTRTSLTGTSDETNGLDTSLVGLITCPTIFKHVDVINLRG